MNDAKQNLATTVRDARTELGLSQERLAEILNIALQKDCTEQEATDLLPMVRYLLELLRKQQNLSLQ